MINALLWNDIKRHKILSLSTVIFMAVSSLFISLAASLLIFYISKILINKKLYDFFVISNLMQISLSNLVLIVLSIIIIFISLYLFLLGFSKRLSVKEELKEE